MPSYCKEALLRFNHVLGKLRHQPHKPTIQTYGATTQCTKEDDASALLSNEEKNFVQQVTGTFIFYARAVDNTMLVVLSAIASKQAAPPQETMEKVNLFLDYVTTHPDTVLTFKKSYMVLVVHSVASSLTEPKARRQA